MGYLIPTTEASDFDTAPTSGRMETDIFIDFVFIFFQNWRSERPRTTAGGMGTTIAPRPSARIMGTDFEFDFFPRDLHREDGRPLVRCSAGGVAWNL